MMVVAIIQARMGSSRLPEKIMADLGGEPMLVRVVERVLRARSLDAVVVATTESPADDVVIELCDRKNWNYVRGSESDVLSRYRRAADAFGAEMVVRITADCPLTDPALIEMHVEQMTAQWSQIDFTTNMAKQTFPVGLAVEALPVDVLARMDRLSDTAYLREHVTTLAYERPELFSINNVRAEEDMSHIRLTVDTSDDLARIQRLYESFDDPFFSWREALSEGAIDA